MKLTEYLRQYMPPPCHDRPFVCDGLPELCTVIIIGNNPATAMESDWWDFWNDKTGFDLSKFEREYLERRRAARKRTAFSPTRRGLNYLRKGGLICLETNAFVNERPGGHGDGIANPHLPYFVRYLPNLKGVIAHGKVAQRCLEKLPLPAHVEPYYLRHLCKERDTKLNQAIEHFAVRRSRSVPTIGQRDGGLQR